MTSAKKGLGAKGLGMEALISSRISDLGKPAPEQLTQSSEIDINKIEPNKSQPRSHFDEVALEELSTSIKEYGIVQPLILRKNGEFFEIVAGERRWRAAKIAGLKTVPAIVKDYATDLAFQVALIENIQREDLNPIEEALSYKRLSEEFNLSQEKTAEKVGKSRSAIANVLRLLNLDERVQNFIVEGKISGSHARTLLGIEDKEVQFDLAERIIEEELSVREIEAIVKRMSEGPKEEEKKEPKPVKADDENYRAIENNLKSMLGTKVKLINKKNKGKIEIEYYSNDELDRLITLFNKLN